MILQKVHNNNDNNNNNTQFSIEFTYFTHASISMYYIISILYSFIKPNYTFFFFYVNNKLHSFMSINQRVFNGLFRKLHVLFTVLFTNYKYTFNLFR